MRRFSLVSISVAVAVLATLTVGSTVAPGAGTDATDIATDYVKDNKQQLGLTGADVNDMRVTNTVVDPGTRTTHVYFQQVHKDIGVYNGLLTVNVAADGWVVSSGNRFVPNLAAAAGGQPAKRADEAAEAAAKHVGLASARSPSRRGRQRPVEEEQGVERRRRRRTDRRRARLEPARRRWRPAGMEHQDRRGRRRPPLVDQRGRRERRRARDERLRRRGHGSRHRVGDRPALRHGGSLALRASAVDTVADGSSYRVFPLPFESPSDGDRSLVQNPAAANASPFGWHDTNGAAGPSSRARGATTCTRTPTATTTTSPIREPIPTAARGSTSTSRST